MKKTGWIIGVVAVGFLVGCSKPKSAPPESEPTAAADTKKAAPKEATPTLKPAPAEPVKCTVKLDEDGNKDITNAVAQVGVVLADDEWETECSNKDAVLSAMGGGIIFAIAKKTAFE